MIKLRLPSLRGREAFCVRVARRKERVALDPGTLRSTRGSNLSSPCAVYSSEVMIWMSGATGAAGAAAAAAAAVAQAIKASGVVVRVEPQEFTAILARAKEPLVVQAPGGWLQKAHHYLTSYKGLAFYTRSDTELALPPGTELIRAKQIWIPG